MRSLLAVSAGRITKWVVVAAWVVLLIVALPFAGQLFSITNDETESYLPRNTESTRVNDLEERHFGGSGGAGQLVVVTYERESGITVADRQRARRDLRVLKERFHSGGRPARLDAATDGKALLYGITLPASLEGDAIVAKVTAIRGVVGDDAGGLRVDVGGPTGFLADQLKSFEGLDTRVLAATLLVVAVLLLLVYRSPVLWLIPLLTVTVGALFAQAGVYGLISTSGLLLTSQSVMVLVVLVYGAGTDYALLLISRYREELRRHQDRHDAMRAALRGSGPAILASAATVSAGLLCLLAASLNSNRSLGPVAAVGVVCALLVMMTLLPALLVILGRWVFWPAIPRYGSQAKQAVGLWQRIGTLVTRRPRRVWIGTTLALGALVLGLTTLNMPLRQVEAFRGTPESVHARQVMLEHYPPGLTRPLHIIADADATERVVRTLRNTPGVAQAHPADRDDGFVKILANLEARPDTHKEWRLIQRVRDRAHHVEGANALVGGHSAVAMDLARANTRDAMVIIPLVLLVVLVILMVLLRALVAPLVLIATVIVSYAATLGLSTLVFTYVFGFSGVSTSLPLLAFIFLVALGVDYNIFLMGRVHEESAHRGTREGMREGLAVTGGVITSAGIVLAATFAVLISMPLVAWAELGFVVALGVLLDTLIVRSVLVPAITMDLDRRIWWPSRLSRPGAVSAEPDTGAPLSEARS